MTDSTTCHRLTPSDPDRVRIVQITDCHILADADKRMHSVDTRRSFETVLELAVSGGDLPDLLLLTGDLSQDGSADSYRYLARHLDATGIPVFWLPGNHDDTDRMRASLTAATIYPARQIVLGNWQIVLLDSTVAGQVGGFLAATELDRMDCLLHDHGDRHALVCLHHQALDAGSRWIDALGLGNAVEFRARLAGHPNVRGVLWGHVHQESRQHRGGIEWLSTPSSCVQFKPGSEEFAIDDALPGYRYLELAGDGRIETRVTRLAGGTPP